MHLQRHFLHRTQFGCPTNKYPSVFLSFLHLILVAFDFYRDGIRTLEYLMTGKYYWLRAMHISAPFQSHFQENSNFDFQYIDFSFRLFHHLHGTECYNFFVSIFRNYSLHFMLELRQTNSIPKCTLHIFNLLRRSLVSSNFRLHNSRNTICYRTSAIYYRFCAVVNERRFIGWNPIVLCSDVSLTHQNRIKYRKFRCKSAASTRTLCS